MAWITAEEFRVIGLADLTCYGFVSRAWSMTSESKDLGLADTACYSLYLFLWL